MVNMKQKKSGCKDSNRRIGAGESHASPMEAKTFKQMKWLGMHRQRMEQAY